MSENNIYEFMMTGTSVLCMPLSCERVGLNQQVIKLAQARILTFINFTYTKKNINIF